MTTQPDHYATLERAIEQYGDRALREMRRVWFARRDGSAGRIIDPVSGKVVGEIETNGCATSRSPGSLPDASGSSP
jgi:hypothetical protein